MAGLWHTARNGVVLFDDDGMLLPDGCVVAGHRAWRTPEFVGR